PRPVVVRERCRYFCKHIWTDGLIENRAESSVGPHAQFPRTASALDSAVVRRWIRRPPEPCGDREVRGGNRDCRSRDPISASVEVPRPTDLTGYVSRAGNRPVIYVPGEILHPSVGEEGLHVVA